MNSILNDYYLKSENKTDINPEITSFVNNIKEIIENNKNIKDYSEYAKNIIIFINESSQKIGLPLFYRLTLTILDCFTNLTQKHNELIGDYEMIGDDANVQQKMHLKFKKLYEMLLDNQKHFDEDTKLLHLQKEELIKNTDKLQKSMKEKEFEIESLQSQIQDMEFELEDLYKTQQERDEANDLCVSLKEKCEGLESNISELEMN